MPEVVSGHTIPPGRQRTVSGAAQTIAEGCERALCESLRVLFLGEKEPRKDSLAMDAPNAQGQQRRTSPVLQAWCEVWSYMADLHFYGAVSQTAKDVCLFVFFDSTVIGRDLKSRLVAICHIYQSLTDYFSLMALMELAGPDGLGCAKLVVCPSRKIEPSALMSLSRDLGWAGFELVTLAALTGQGELTSEEWLFFEIET